MKHAIGWRLGCQAYSFRTFTLLETIEKNAALGLTVLEAYPTQVLSPDRRDVKFDHTSPQEYREIVKAKLKETDVKLVSYGVCGLSKDEAEARAYFDFARDMGIQIIVSEPPEEAMPLVDKLCQEYDIHVAIHNHPKPSHYWSPDTVLKVCKGRSPYIGSCADTGHWVRSDVDPLEAMQKLEGRIISLHIKDVDRVAPDAQDVPWGTGVGNVDALFAEVWRQKLKPVFSIEYVIDDELDPQSDIAECVAYFKKTCDGFAQG